MGVGCVVGDKKHALWKPEYFPIVFLLQGPSQKSHLHRIMSLAFEAPVIRMKGSFRASCGGSVRKGEDSTPAGLRVWGYGLGFTLTRNNLPF